MGFVGDFSDPGSLVLAFISFILASGSSPFPTFFGLFARFLVGEVLLTAPAVPSSLLS